MRPITDIRRDRLRQLIDEVAEGNQAKFAEMIGKSRAYVGFWLADPEVKAYAKQISHEQARGVEEEMRRRGFRQYAAGWLDTDHESQAARLDFDRMGHALTAIDKVLRARGIRFERQLGKFRSLVTYAYEVQEDSELFPKGVNSENRSRYDRIVDEALAGGLESGAFGKVEMVAIEGAGRTRPRAAKSKKAGSRGA